MGKTRCRKEVRFLDNQALESIIMMAGYILTSFGISKILGKCGEPEYFGWIPFVRLYKLFEKFWRKEKFWWMLAYYVMGIVSLTAFTVQAFFTTGINLVNESKIPEDAFVGANPRVVMLILLLGVLFLVVVLLAFILQFRLMKRVSAAFGHGLGYTLGLLFLDEIFLLVLGLNKEMPFSEKREE